jgi:hypothetical protein
VSALLIAVFALVALAFAAGGAVLVLAALRALGTRGLQRTDRHEGNGNSCENRFHKYFFHLKTSEGFARKNRAWHRIKQGFAAEA